MGLFVDIKLNGTAFERFAVNSAAEQEALLRLAKKALAGMPAARAAR